MLAGLNFCPSCDFGRDCAAISANVRFTRGRASPAFAANSMKFRRDTMPEKRSSIRLLIVVSSLMLVKSQTTQSDVQQWRQSIPFPEEACHIHGIRDA